MEMVRPALITFDTICTYIDCCICFLQLYAHIHAHMTQTFASSHVYAAHNTASHNHICTHARVRQHRPDAIQVHLTYCTVAIHINTIESTVLTVLSVHARLWLTSTGLSRKGRAGTLGCARHKYGLSEQSWLGLGFCSAVFKSSGTLVCAI